MEVLRSLYQAFLPDGRRHVSSHHTAHLGGRNDVLRISQPEQVPGYLNFPRNLSILLKLKEYFSPL
jgi:hypothetical protein